MSEMKDMMTRKIFLDVCMGIEKLCAELYHCYSKIYADIPEACSFWKKAALDKENLRKQYEVLLRLLNEIEFDVSADSLKRAYCIQNQLLKLLEHTRNSKPDLTTAFSKSAEIEGSLEDMHAHASISGKIPCASCSRYWTKLSIPMLTLRNVTPSIFM